MRKLIVAVALVLGLYGYWQENPGLFDELVSPRETAAPSVADSAALAKAYENRVSDLQVRGKGVVVKVLPDDNEGSRHQRFILRLPSGQTLLVAHNIDLAPRIPALAEGDAVAFYGEYEWNAQGGVIHWTHRDPQGRHAHGWLRRGGEIYQ